jgi:hypothetical protein
MIHAFCQDALSGAAKEIEAGFFRYLTKPAIKKCAV